MPDIAYLQAMLKFILHDENRTINFQRYLCYVILPRFDDIARDYLRFEHFKKCKNVHEFLSHIFDIDIQKIQKIIERLKEFKNKTQHITECMAVKI